MKKTVLTIVITSLLFTLVSCSEKAIPLKSSPDRTPYEIKVEKPFDDVWDNLIDLFAHNGFSIKTIDKSSGLIISSQTILIATIEDNNGKPENQNAHLVVAKTYNIGRDKAMPVVGYHPTKSKNGKSELNDVYGEWNVRIKKHPDGGSTINVNLVNIEYLYTDGRSALKRPLSSADFYSTRLFENLISNSIK